MQTTVRSRAVAAMLLALAGAAFLSTPASAASYVLPGAVPHQMLQRFDLLGALATNSEVYFRVYGTAGGQATVHVPGVLEKWPLKEVQPGVYEGSYLIPPGVNPGLFRQSVATLQVQGVFIDARPGGAGIGLTPRPGSDTPPVVAQEPRHDRDARRDGRGPVISDVSPSHGERLSDRGRTRITARFGDDASGIDPRSVSLRVDGRDVTAASRVDGDGIDYRENLAPGRHRAELVVRDRAGNVSRRTWDFDVVGDGRYGYGYGNERRW